MIPRTDEVGKWSQTTPTACGWLLLRRDERGRSPTLAKRGRPLILLISRRYREGKQTCGGHGKTDAIDPEANIGRQLICTTGGPSARREKIGARRQQVQETLHGPRACRRAVHGTVRSGDFVAPLSQPLSVRA